MNIQIKSKKDWCIAFILAFLIVYALTGSFSRTFQELLLPISNFRLTEMNQPASYGNFIVTVLIMTFLTTIVMTCLHKSKKLILMILLGGLLLSSAVLKIYQLHCDLIVSVINTEDPGTIAVFKTGRSSDYELTADQELEIINYCLSLEPAEAPEAARMKERLNQAGVDKFADSWNIWIPYGRKYGHYFTYMIYGFEDIVYIHNGYGYGNKELITICADNGLVGYLDGVGVGR